MAWVKWVDGKVEGNAMYPEKRGEGEEWREIIIEDAHAGIDQKLIIIEEDGVLYKRAIDKELDYKKKRIKEYPHYRDQLDMIYHDLINETTTWEDKITEIKDKYPKE